MKTVQVAANSYWVGKVDDRKVPFHRLVLEKGTTYNSYLLLAEKPTVIDTVDISFGKEYVDNLQTVIDPADIQYIVINHVEPDHAGALPALAARAKNAVIVTTELGAELLKDMFRLHGREFLVVKDNDTLDIGGKTLRFLETPYLHTAETMVTYVEEDRVLYPCDQFSTHVATYELFNDLVEEDISEDFGLYYQLIMHPHWPYVRKMLEKIRELSIDVIAPSHGYILREGAQRFIEMYDVLSAAAMEGAKQVTIAYSSMTGNTGKVAEQLSRGLAAAGVTTSVFNLKQADLEEVKQAVSASNGILIGSSTRYADMVGRVEQLLQGLDTDEVIGKPAAAFGSYGWSGEAISHIEDYLGRLGATVVNRAHLTKATGVDAELFPLRVKFGRSEELARAQEAGRVFGETLRTK